MEDVEPALRPNKLVVAQANVEDDRLLCPGQIGNAKQILGFEIGDDDRGALAQDFLRLGGYVAVGGEQFSKAWLLPLNLPSLFRRLLFGTP